jgi:hypothetical protein
LLTLSLNGFSQGDMTYLTEVSISCVRTNTGATRVTQISGGGSGFYGMLIGWFSSSVTITEYRYTVICDNGFEDSFWM